MFSLLIFREAEDAQIGTLPEDAAQTTEVGQSSFQDQYYTAADGIVELTIKSEKGALHKGYYLFDTNGYLVTERYLLMEQRARQEQLEISILQQ